MTETVCPVCTAAQPDGLLCHGCTTVLEQALGDVRSLVTDLQVSISKQAKIGNPSGKGGLARERSPINWGAVEAADTLGNVLTTWARDVTGAGIAGRNPTNGAVYLLLRNVDAIRRHPAVAELLDEITDAVEQARRAVDRPADRMYLGQCYAAFPDEDGQDVTCYAEIWAREGAHETSCRVCGITHEVAERREGLLGRAGHLIVTVKQASEYLGEFGNVPVNQKTIRTWLDRGQLPVHPGPTEERHIKLGDLLALLVDKAARAAA